MKTKLVVIATILLSLIVIVFNKGNSNINGSLLGMFNPIKLWYQNGSAYINNGIENYILQASSIEKLREKNLKLEQSSLMQKNYIEQTKQLKDIIPSLSKLPADNKVEITQTISYVKMNNFTEILLTKPELVKEGVPYGLIKNGVINGVGKLIDNQFYGYLTSSDKCRLSVQVGSQKAPGVAIGDGKSNMTVQFIPRLFNIKVGDKVVSSGLDGIFYANIPLGVVTKVEAQSSYKVAYINTYNDLYHPKLFFVLSDEKQTVFAQSSSIKNNINTTSSILDTNTTSSSPSSLSSTPLVEIDQTRSDIVVPEQEIARRTIYKPKKRIKKVKPNRVQTPVPRKNTEIINQPIDIDEGQPVNNEPVVNTNGL